MLLAEVADGAEVGAVIADDGEEGEVAFAGEGNLAAGEDADAIGVSEEGDHLGGVERRSTASFDLVGSIKGGEVQPGDEVDEEEHEIAVGEVFRRRVVQIGVCLRVPRAILL